MPIDCTPIIVRAINPEEVRMVRQEQATLKHDEVQRLIEADEHSSVETIARRAYRELRAALMGGEFLPATTLTLRALADRLGTSIMPIREAVSRLAAEHALELRPNRAIRVPELSRVEIDHLWQIRLLIESEAAGLAATAANPAQIAALSSVCETMWQAYRASDARAMVAGTGRWTMLLAEASGSAPFIDYISNLRLRCAPLIARALASGIDPDDPFFAFSLRLQDQIVDALQSRHVARARDLRLADVRSFQGFVYRRVGWG
jgi:GntR family transcriptional regulator, colanic acid and biofilm gene transcriptional regulator